VRRAQTFPHQKLQCVQLQVLKTDEGRSPTSDWRAKLMLEASGPWPGLPPHAQRPCRWRPRKLTPEDIVAARKHMIDGKLKAKDIAKMYGVSERSLWRNLRWAAELEEVRAG
jgi:hypothetical protein